MKVTVRLTRGRQETGLDLIHINRYAPGPNGLLREVRLEQTLPGGMRSVHHGKFVKDTFQMTVSSGGKTSTLTVDAPKEESRGCRGCILSTPIAQIRSGALNNDASVRPDDPEVTSD